MFQTLDRIVYNGRPAVQTVYEQEYYPLPNRGTPDSRVVNTEHTWPRSHLKHYPRFRSSQADLYHLFPTTADVNAQRGNLPFADCKPEGSHWSICEEGFEPPDSHKGTVARAMFYMAITYNMPIENHEESLLRQWSFQFPPEKKELQRGAMIKGIQGNKNPFIENPDWIQDISDF